MAERNGPQNAALADERDLSSAAPDEDTETTPLHWFLAGDNPQNYRLTSDRRVVWSGTASASVEVIDKTVYRFGTLMQMASAETVRGQRVEFAAFVRTAGTPAGAALWFRADDANGVVIAFDNMAERWIRGDTKWTDHGIVIDVPPTAVRIAYGVLLIGRGKVWIDDAQLASVDGSVPTTAPPVRPRPEIASGLVDTPRLPPAPRNLDFEETVPIEATGS